MDITEYIHMQSETYLNFRSWMPDLISLHTLPLSTFEVRPIPQEYVNYRLDRARRESMGRWCTALRTRIEAGILNPQREAATTEEMLTRLQDDGSVHKARTATAAKARNRSDNR